MADVFDFYVYDNRSIVHTSPEPIMQEDKDVAVWRFRIPKVLNNIDMSAWSWWFVYVNAKGQKFSELLTLNNDIDDPENFSTADYPIGYGISKTPGGFTFALEAINAEQGGEIDGEWHTRTYTHTVTPTLQGNQAEYTETESDIISALIVEVQNKYNALVGGATPLSVNLKSLMVDHDKVYLYTGSEPNESTRYWYYWNGTNFVPGGVYGAGDPEAVQGYVEDWLDAHPEATTTVQDGAITENKLADNLKLKTINNYATPEMYGAKGDGVTDDTQAWQSAVESGKKVIATKSAYKCGKITVSADTEIDCANASFICTENILFDCSGSVADSVSGSDYSAWQTDYNIGDSYTGLAMLKGTNNAFHARTYYYGGFVCECVYGIVKNSYPVDVTNVTIEKINPITVNIKNIKNVVFGEPDVNKVVRLLYNKNSIVENVTQHGECFSIVSFESSYGCIAQNCEIRQTTQPQIVGYAYPIEFIDSSYCIASHCKITNLYWHSITTGGNYLCYGNVVEDCILHSANAIPAYHDHENGIGTKLLYSEISTATVGALSEVEGCTILSCGGTYKESAVRLLATDNAEIARYKLVDIKIIGADGGNNGYYGVCIYSAPQVSDEYEYHVSNVIIDNLICMHDTLTARLHKRGSGTVTFDTVNMSETNLTVMVNVSNVFFKNFKAVRSDTYPAVGGTGYSIDNVLGENSFIGNFVGTIGNIRLSNCISKASLTNATAAIHAMVCALTVAKAVMTGGKLYAKNCTVNNSAEPLDVIGISGVGYYGRYTANGYTVTQIT